MKKILFLIFVPCILAAANIYESHISEPNKAAMENKKIKCRWVCDKKLYKEQKIAEAIEFYKNSKDYKFTKKDF